MKIHQYLLLLISILILSCNTATAQTINYIEGNIINAYTSEPVPFACIFLLKNQLGIYANADGDFRISNNLRFRSDSVVITCIGFKRQSIALSSLSENIVNYIPLSPLVHVFDDINVVAYKKVPGSTVIISKAIRNISKNLPDTPFTYISYYRDYQKSNKEYINLNEAIVQTLDNGFKSDARQNMYRLLDYKKNDSFPRISISPYYDTVAYFNTPNKILPRAKIGDQYGNELLILMVHDAIRNYKVRSFSYINIFSKDFLDNHDFLKPERAYNNDIQLYKIQFSAKKSITGDSLSANGTIYIQSKDYSIHKLEYSCQYLTWQNQIKELYHITIEYGYESSLNNSMCLKYISFNNAFTILDQNDNSYFRITDSKWDPESSSSILTLTFNNSIDAQSAKTKENYEILIGNEICKIKDIEVRDTKILIKLKDENLQLNSPIVMAKNLKDINGNILDRRKEIEFNQYRELFVQEYSNRLSFKDSCYMKQLPIEENCISHEDSQTEYWMNTPKNISIK